VVITGDGGQSTRRFAAGAFVFEVATSNTNDAAIFEALFADLPEPASAGGVARFTARRSGDDEWHVAGPRLEDQPILPLDGALTRLMSAVNVCALDADPSALHLHAACATKDGRAVVIAAERNTGKTTTVAHLVERGWVFVTDEMVRLGRDDELVAGFSKPISIKPGGFELLPHLEANAIPPGGSSDVFAFGFVPLGTSGAEIGRNGRPHLAVLLKRPDPQDQGAEPVVSPLHPADAVVSLMQQTLDAERYHDAAERLARLAAVSHCFTLSLGTPQASADAIDRLAALDPVAPLDVVVLPESAGVSEGVVSITIGTRAVVHDRSTGRIFALDEGATRVWLTLGGWESDPAIDLEGAVLGPFVSQLRGLGVLTPAR
jgi:hypothetical protein